tara:strand:- start:1545 stop:1715 length:171 start_codon:yes stop_codon:yes gene_type:complete
MSKENIPSAIEIPIHYRVNSKGQYILEYDTMHDAFTDKMKSLDSYLVKLKRRRDNE